MSGSGWRRPAARCHPGLWGAARSGWQVEDVGVAEGRMPERLMLQEGDGGSRPPGAGAAGSITTR